MEGLHFKVPPFQPDTDSSSWNHTWVVAVPDVVPVGMPENHSNRSQVASGSRDKRQAVPLVQQNVTVPDNAMAQDSSSPVETARHVVCGQGFRVELSVACSGLQQAFLLSDEWPVSRQLAR